MNKNISETGSQSTQELKKEDSMKKAKRLIGMIGVLLCGALPGFTTSAQPAVSVGVSVGLPSVEIRAASDFYEPLTPYGRWEVVGSYGRCWIPGRVEAGWRPYCNGYWQRTDAGWYWVSAEPWAWATYHYGRWNLSAQFGWYWVPQTQWAPAWVSWHSGGGYIGWAPLYPSGVRVISPQAYVFVNQGRFLDPVSPATVVVNNTLIINKTVINKAPATAAIEKASGRKVQAVQVQELRHKEEAAVVAKQKTPTSPSQTKVLATARSGTVPSEKKTVVAYVPPQVEKPAVAPREYAAPAPQNSKTQSEMRKPVPAATEAKPAPAPEIKHPTAIKEPTPQISNKQPIKQVKPAQPVSEQPAKEKPAVSEKTESNTGDKNHENKGKE
jgi:hypothetical protein